GGLELELDRYFFLGHDFAFRLTNNLSSAGGERGEDNTKGRPLKQVLGRGELLVWKWGNSGE
ncbi:MAG TPA: hypothetical protein VHS31_04730, partial [Tepidisphaeraceae bacterium]|nr:hypothetical protein [Tepidisphaeraceae bacterium]